MKWESAKKYLHSVDVKNIKSIARERHFKLSGRNIESIFRMVRESGEIKNEDIALMERGFEASAVILLRV